ncbi:MAG: hypothetical protein IJG82_07700 [Atopobiaceae bacterium]|nr:hypothetical protein [Atopobiaceae bacterium]
MTYTRLNPEDSGWKTLTLASNAQAYDSNSAPRYRKIGSTVFLDGKAKPKEEVAAGDTLLIGTLPSGYRPEREHISIMQGSSQAIWMLRVYTDGNVSAQRYRNGATAAAMPTTAWLPVSAEFAVG